MRVVVRGRGLVVVCVVGWVEPRVPSGDNGIKEIGY